MTTAYLRTVDMVNTNGMGAANFVPHVEHL